MSKKEKGQWGGAREAGPGKKIGRPPSPFITKQVKVSFASEEEYKLYMKLTKDDPRVRATLILEELGG